jgi:hypothetical protein
MVDDPDVTKRAELLPEEQAAGSDDPKAQAEAVLAESVERQAVREWSPEDAAAERRTSEEVAVDPD